MTAKTKRRHRHDVPLALVLSLLAASAAAGERVEVKMLNYDRDDPSRVMVYEPEIVRIEPGDTVVWVSVDDLHNTQSVDGMIPDGAEPWASPLSEDFEMTFEVEGTYGYICQPHQMLGMAGLVLVGDHTKNLEAARAAAQRGPLADKFDDLFAAIE